MNVDMNILYISFLTGMKSEGPNYSVPNQIQAQSKYDNVLWFNVNNASRDCWDVDVDFVSLTDIPKIDIGYLPKPFNKPDLVIFQGLYTFHFCKIARRLKKNKIQYIIIPRSSLTLPGQQSKPLKKKIGNLLFFNEFIKNAAAVQYLTEGEYKSSGDKWNKTSLIIPNGIDKKSKSKVFESKTDLRGVFIGRLDVYQKGIDLLIEACSMLKTEMKSFGCIVDLYGPEHEGGKIDINELIAKNGVKNFIRLHDAVFDCEKEAVLLNSDFFILTSRFEGHPVGLIEALSYGLPCLVTAGTNMADEVAAFDAGWTAKASIRSIAEALEAVIRDRKSLAVKGQNALKLSQKYSWDAIAELSNKKYEELLNKM
jgi:glycosyltransferase involved in cell wall biosynthesis